MDSEALARAVIAKLRSVGHQAWLVGGCVRDLLLGRKPKDFDVATDARPDRDHGPVSRVPAGWARTSASCWYATVFARWKSPPSAATTTTRTAAGPTPSTSKRDPRQDVAAPRLHHQRTADGPRHAARCSITWAAAPTWSAGLIRAIGDPEARFREDHLRLLRAVRFAARLEFAIDPATFEAMQADHAADPARLGRSGSATNWSAS